MESNKTKHLTVDTGIIASLGRESIKDHTTAILELIKNSYDAGASIVDVEIFANIRDPYIRIADNGSGMTEEAIDKYWLRVGYSEKRENRKIKNRRKTGEKGIGRLSADRLGEILDMRTRTPIDGDLRVVINWSDFDRMGINLSEVNIDFFRNNVAINLPKYKSDRINQNSGTEIIIKKLRQSGLKQILTNCINNYHY